MKKDENKITHVIQKSEITKCLIEISGKMDEQEDIIQENPAGVDTSFRAGVIAGLSTAWDILSSLDIFEEGTEVEG